MKGIKLIKWLAAGFCFTSGWLLLVPAVGAAQNIQPRTADTLQKPKSFHIDSLTVKVTDIETGRPLDSAMVSFGNANPVYTNKQGVLVAHNITLNTIVGSMANGYFGQSKKATGNLHFRMLKNKRTGLSFQENAYNGLYSRPEDHFTGWAGEYGGEKLRQLNPVNLMEALAIADPSLVALRNNRTGNDPNSTDNVYMRGLRNFPANASIATKSGTLPQGVQINPAAADFIASQVMQPNTPIILLDGVQISLQQLADLDIFRIEKIRVLKDAPATAAYGSRAGNGVILVQTKKPEKGTMNVQYTGQLQVVAPDLRSYNLMEATGKLELEKQAGMYAGNDALYQKRLTAVNNGINTDWLKEATQTGVGSRHGIQLDGGDEAMKYGLNFGYNSLDGAMKGSSRVNTNIAGYFSAQVKNLFFSNHLLYNQTKGTNSPYGNFETYAGLNPYWSNIDTATGGTPKLLEEYKVATPGGDSLIKVYNPAYNSSIATTNKTEYGYLANHTQLVWVPGGGFTVSARFALQSGKEVADMFLPPSHTVFSQYTPSQFFKRGQYNQTTSQFQSYDGAAQLLYQRQEGLHFFYGATGVNGLATKSNSTSILVQGFTSDQLPNISFGSAYSTGKPITGKVNTSLLAGFVNMGYSYGSRYQLDATFAREGNSLFGENNRYANYYSLGLSWNLHQEAFLAGLDQISLLRLKGGIGTVGSSFFQSYLANTGYNYYTNQQYLYATGNTETRGVGNGAFLTGYANPNLGSQLVNKQNFGLELGLWQNRLQMQAAWYKETSKDLVLPLFSPGSTGFGNFSYYENLGEIENKGFEWNLRFAAIKQNAKGMGLVVGVNGLSNTNTLLNSAPWLDTLNNRYNSSTYDQTRPQPQYKTGQSLTAIYAVPSLGIDPSTGREQFRKADGTTSTTWDAADKINAGDLMPSLTGSFGANLSWKNAMVGAWFYYQSGSKVYNQTLADKIENADLTYNVDDRASANRWQQPGDKALYKPLYLNGRTTDPTYATTRFVEDASFLQAASLSASYTWPKFEKLKLPLQQTSIGFAANRSLGTFIKNAEKGIAYPFAAFYTFSIRTSFK